jgi:putative nucleotidyltransferase with HDIG domain
VTQVATKQRRTTASQKRTRPSRQKGATEQAKSPRAQGHAKTSKRNGAVAKPAKAVAKRAKSGAKPATSGDRRSGQGGRRLAAAFDGASRLPALAESRRRLLLVSERRGSSPAELAEVIESDVALTIAVMRAAGANGDGRTGGVRQAIEALSEPGMRKVVASIDAYDPLESPSALASRNEQFRRHAVATRHAADRVAELVRLPDRDELAVAALVHDLGQLVLGEMYGQFEGPNREHMAPEERVRCERRELGIDHALVGAVLVRRWGFPRGVATAVEQHHSPEADGHAAAIRLGDLMVHHARGDAAPTDAIAAAAARLGIDQVRLAALLYEFPHSGTARRRAADPCPLSVREIDALRGLAEGKVYKQIAHELSLSVSTIRTHLHNVYRKIGAVDRAQAVLIARDRGWI